MKINSTGGELAHRNGKDESPRSGRRGLLGLALCRTSTERCSRPAPVTASAAMMSWRQVIWARIGHGSASIAVMS